MFAKVIADRYARALLMSCGGDDTRIDRAKTELELVGDVYDKHDEIRAFLVNPKVPQQLKVQVFSKSLEGKLSENVLSLFKLLIEKRRHALIPEIAIRFGELCDQVRGVEHATITTAIPVDSSLRERLIQQVQKFSSRGVDVEFKVDPEILGGVVIRLGDKVIDGSLGKKFEDIRRAMLAVRLPRTIDESG